MKQDIINAFEAGTHWKEKYSKIVDDDIRIPDVDKYMEEITPERFWNTREGMITSHGMHDFNNGLCGLSSYLAIIKHFVEQGKLDTTALLEDLGKMQTCITMMKEGIDYIYVKLKEDFETIKQ